MNESLMVGDGRCPDCGHEWTDHTVYLTRDRDIFIPLYKRPRIAKAKNAVCLRITMRSRDIAAKRFKTFENIRRCRVGQI